MQKEKLMRWMFFLKLFFKKENKKSANWTSDHKFSVCRFLLQNEQAAPPPSPPSLHHFTPLPPSHSPPSPSSPPSPPSLRHFQFTPPPTFPSPFPPSLHAHISSLYLCKYSGLNTGEIKCLPPHSHFQTCISLPSEFSTLACIAYFACFDSIAAHSM